MDPHTNLIYAVQGWVGEDPMVRNGRVPVLVLPCSSASEAKARLRWEKLSTEDKEEAIARVIARSHGGSVILAHDYSNAKAILTLQGTNSSSR